MNDLVAASQYKNSRLFETLKKQIETYALKAGDRLPSERHLCELYGCSRSTVRSSLKHLEELKLVKRVHGSGTYVFGQKRNVQKRKNIAVIFSTAADDERLKNDPYLSQVLIGLQGDGGNNRCNFNFLKLHPSETVKTFFKKKKEYLEEFDGLICLLDSMSKDDVLYLRKKGIAFVATMPAQEEEKVSYVEIDNLQGVYMATKHLLALGRKQICFVSGELKYALYRTRLQGFKKALLEYGIDYQDSMYHETLPSKQDRSYDAVKEVCEGHKDNYFDALIVCGGWQAFSAYQLLKKDGVKIPQDVAVVMYDDIPWAQGILSPSVTAVRQPVMEQVRRMLRIVINIIEGKEKATVIEILQPQLMIRESSGKRLNDQHKES